MRLASVAGRLAAAAVVACLAALSGPLSAGAAAGWTIVPSPNSTATQNDYLLGVSCTGPTFCVAAGYYSSTVPATSSVSAYVNYNTLIEQWDGSTWSIADSPNDNGGEPSTVIVNNFLYGVSCATPDFCMAAGVYDCWACDANVPGATGMYVEQWDGSSWTLHGVPYPSGVNNVVPSAITCVSTSFCLMAASYSDSQSIVHALNMAWNGSAWSRVPAPDNPLTGLSCTSRTYCIGVGGYAADVWNGSSLSPTAPLPAQPSGSIAASMTGVSCPGPADCRAVGVWDDNGITNQTLIDSWDGSAWTAVAAPDPAAGDNMLLSLSCSSDSFCASSGDGDNGTTQGSTTLIVQFDGATWQGAPSPDAANATFNFLLGVSCPTDGFCMAVGYADSGPMEGACMCGRPYQTLIEELSQQPPIQVPDAPSPTLLLLAPTLAAALGRAGRRRWPPGGCRRYPFDAEPAATPR